MVVVGAGVAGLTAARILAEAGCVVVIDGGAICAGTTGYTTVKVTALHGLVYDELIRSHGPERARVYADANQWAFDGSARWSPPTTSRAI